MEGFGDLFQQDGTFEHITESYEFPASGVSLEIQQMEYENCQLEVGVPLVVWRASLSLSQWLDKNQTQWLKSSSDPVSALELGSGTGLLGLFTIKRLLQENQGSKVTLTDMEQSSLDLLAKNIELNALTTEQVSASYLKWGDFTSPIGEQSFDLIVGSDIIYNNYVLEPLAQTIEKLLKPGSNAYIANNKVRYDNYGRQFEVELEKAGLIVQERIDIQEDKGTQVMRLLIIKK
ncbi:hypothetical protein FGO68_gene12920 [Halteria grandinella]|uniref:Methyltransferase domain-containing protein n=1 Tax=Halteria grandinella TaxID=5974 RepID=A0A8J8SVP3_HALGN|nr:hypothetical protein FGO68_gene12920 [Halteria grandinella]